MQAKLSMISYSYVFISPSVCETTVALVVRRGNPKNIQGFADLVQEGLQVRGLGLAAAHMGHVTRVWAELSKGFT
jgi:accessory colonization factor AcfC